MSNLVLLVKKQTPLVHSVLRIVVAFLFMMHGAQKLFAFPTPMDGFTLQLLSLGGASAILEFFGGLFVLLGLFTRPAAFILSGEMAVAYFMVHAPGGFWPILNHGELAVLFCFVFFYFAFSGSGPVSLDRMIRKID